MIPTATALEAADTWQALANLIPTIELYLVPRPGKSEVHAPPASKPPIDLVASDLLLEIDLAADFYVSALLMETADITRAPDTLAGRLALIAERHGHFTADPDEKVALDFCDEAHELMRKVAALVTQPAPPRFMGPCLTACGGDLWLRHGRIAATCDACGSEADLGAVREQLMHALESRLMRQVELTPALRLIGANTNANTVRQWASRGRLVPAVTMGDVALYRFADAIELAGVQIAA